MSEVTVPSQINYQRPSRSEEPLWTYHVNPYMKYSLYLAVIASVAILVVAFSGLFWSGFNSDFIVDFIDQTHLLFFLYVGIIGYLYVGSFMVYSIYHDHISFKWGLLKKRRVDIPFTDIISIQLVTYNDRKTSTIFFGTKSEYSNLKKYDFENHDTRPHITFEKVKNGQEVYDLLQSLKNNH